MARSNYITREGWQVLDEELKYLWKKERPLITRSVSEAAAQGDLLPPEDLLLFDGALVGEDVQQVVAEHVPIPRFRPPVFQRLKSTHHRRPLHKGGIGVV
jgi:hypothetical protein